MSAPIVFWQHLSPAIPYFGLQDPQHRDYKLTPPPNFPHNSLITAKDRWWGFEFSHWFRQGGDTRTVQALPRLCGFFAWSIKMFQCEQDLQVLTDSNSNAICTLLFFAPQTQWTCLADCILLARCPLASVLASEESWWEFGAERVLVLCKPYHRFPPLFKHWSDGCFSTRHTAECKRGVINM